MPKICLELNRESLRFLAVLAENGDPRVTIMDLIRAAVEGLRRPGSWEREWLARAIYDFDSLVEIGLEPDPKCEWHLRPHAREVSREAS